MKQNGAKDNRPLLDQLKEYQNIWSDMMCKIWQDRVELYHARRTGNLHDSISGGLQQITQNLESTLRFEFPQYGVYVENAVGNHYTQSNGGDLPFLDPVYRAEHRLDRRKKVGPAWGGYYQSGNPRQKKPWLSPSWGISRRVMGDAMTSFIGNQFFGMFDQISK